MKSKPRKRKLFSKIVVIVIALAFGFFLTTSIFKALKNQFKLSTWASVAISLLVLLPIKILIVFHKPTRCFFFLLIPQMLSKKGRTAVIAYAFYITFSGPMRNLTANVGVLSDCIACGQVRRWKRKLTKLSSS
jgi:protein-S-isoprenylcysteine O-methyltransferase Ste14